MFGPNVWLVPLNVLLIMSQFRQESNGTTLSIVFFLNTDAVLTDQGDLLLNFIME